MPHILLVEDDTDLAATIVDYLLLESITCDHADNGQTGLHLASTHSYSAILLDINLPRRNGLSVCEQLRAEGCDTPVLMLTAREQLDDKLAGFAAGADDYLVKPFELRELTARVLALSRRRSGQAQILRCGDLCMDIKEKTVTRQGRCIPLTPTAWRLLEALLRASPTIVSRQHLLEAVWGDNPPDSDSLKVHLFHLRKNIDAPFATTLLHTVPGHGFVLREAEA